MDAKSNFRETVLSLAPYNVSGHPAKVKLNQNESPFDIPAELKREIIDGFSEIGWNRYPQVFSTELPEKLAKIHEIPHESFIVSNGSNELIYTIAMSIVHEKTKVLIPQPTFYLFEKVCTILGAEILKINAKDDLSFDADSILNMSRGMSRGLIILGSPNNPTGKSLPESFLGQLLSSTGAMVLLDEAYIEFSSRRSSIGLVKQHKNLVVLRTFSKAFSLAGLRIGYLAAHPDTAFEILKVKIPFTVNPLSEFTALKLLEHRNIFDERVRFLLRQKEEMMSALRGMPGVSVVESDANFFLFSSSIPPAEMFSKLLDKKNVLVRDVSSYPLLGNYLRVNAGSADESAYFTQSVRECLERL